MIDAVFAKHSAGSDQAPDDTGGEKGSAVGTGEVVFLGGGADFGDAGEGPVHGGDLDNGGPDGGEHLAGEGRSGAVELGRERGGGMSVSDTTERSRQEVVGRMIWMFLLTEFSCNAQTSNRKYMFVLDRAQWWSRL